MELGQEKEGCEEIMREQETELYLISTLSNEILKKNMKANTRTKLISHPNLNEMKAIWDKIPQFTREWRNHKF
jgi:hypothetical protein